MSLSLASVVILAAGLGTRMKSATPKVLHEVCGAPLLSYVLAATRAVEAPRTIVVLGHGHESVRPTLSPDVEVALQHSQRGTGDALLAAAAELGELGPDAPGGDALLVVPGDTPLITGEVLLGLVEAHVASGADATVLTMDLPDPTGYGRVLRDPDGLVTRIVEHRDASPAELAVTEVNTGMYVLPARRALDILRRAGTENAQGELYLTDVIAGLRARGARVGAHATDDPSVTLGVNSRVELAEVQGLLRARILRHWMLAGVTIDDPGSTHVDAGVTLEADVRLLPGTCLRGTTSVATGSDRRPPLDADRHDRRPRLHRASLVHRRRHIGGGGDGGALQLPASRRHADGGCQGGGLRRGEEEHHRPGQQGAAPELHRRRDHRRGYERRRGQHHRELRR